MVRYIPPELYPLAVVLLLSALSVAGGLIAYFLKDIRSGLSKEQARQDAEIDGLQKGLNDLKASLPREYVLREDFNRELSVVQNKLDRIGRDIHEMNRLMGKLAKGGGGDQ